LDFSQPLPLVPHRRMDLAGTNAGAAAYISPSQPSPSFSQPRGSMDTQAGQGQAQGHRPSYYPAALQNWVANQGPLQSHRAADTQGGCDASGFATGSGQATESVPTSSLAPNPSAISVPSMHTTSSLAGSTGMYQRPMIPVFGGPVQYENRSNQTGSLVGIHDQRISQLANEEPPYPSDPIYDPNVYDPNMYYAEGSLPSSAGPSSAIGSSRAASSSGARDGKGRQLVVMGNKASVVHLDGRVFEGRRPGPNPDPDPVVQAGPAPPGYWD